MSNYENKDLVLGLDKKIPLLNGEMVRYVNLDNAASTPSLTYVKEILDKFLPYYSSVHRGTGFKSRLSTIAYDQAHEIIARFVGANPKTNTVIFGKNTTEAINKLSFRLNVPEDHVVITTAMEHHSNDLPWRAHAKVVHVNATPEGNLDEADFDKKLKHYEGKIALVAVTGASNVSGYIQPIHRLARKVHEVGAKIMIDAAQLAPHRQINMLPDEDPEHLDFVVIAGHKMYAPYGTGALIGPKDFFKEGAPEYTGGGTVKVVTLDEVHYDGPPERDEAGSPNVVGAVAMAAAAKKLMEIGMDKVAAHEEELIKYILPKLNKINGVTVFGETDPAKAHTKVGAIPVNLEGVHHALLAAILGYEGGIGVRNGCFCAHPYVVHLLNVPENEVVDWQKRFLGGDKSDIPGLIRISFGLYNTTDDIDRVIEMLERVRAGDYQGKYEQNKYTGEFSPIGFEEPLSDHFLLDD